MFDNLKPNIVALSQLEAAQVSGGSMLALVLVGPLSLSVAGAAGAKAAQEAASNTAASDVTEN